MWKSAARNDAPATKNARPTASPMLRAFQRRCHRAQIATAINAASQIHCPARHPAKNPFA